MRLESEIRDKIKIQEEMLEASLEMNDFDMIGYFKGWIDALKWVLGEE